MSGAALLPQARYFGLRRVNPYRGLTLVVDAGDASAQSQDGVTWHLRCDDGFGWVRPTGIWRAEEGLLAGAGRQPAELIAALEAMPAVPFALADRLECWLLDHEGSPLALLDTALPSAGASSRIDPAWQPFVQTFAGFRSPSLAAHQQGQRQPTAHRDLLARMVNDAARPHPAAQWFRRLPDDRGEARDGLRLRSEWVGRTLAAEAFPPLLLRENWNNLLEQSVITDYHAFMAPLLLLLPHLDLSTRLRLEQAACANPGWLERVFRLLPAQADPARLQAARVAARLQAASAAPDDSPF